MSGTRIDVAAKQRPLQKRAKDVDDKRRKIDEIEQKYDLKPRRDKRGLSYQKPDRAQPKPVASAQPDGLASVGLNASKITAHKREAFKMKKGSEMASEKIVYKSKRNIDNEQIDEKLRTQTFRFTNQFKSDDGGEPNYFKEEGQEEEDIYGEFIEEEIESKSQDSPKNNVKPMNLIKNPGPQEIPSDTNPMKGKREVEIESVEMIGTPLNKPPRVPPKINSKNSFQSPAQQIFKTAKQKQKEAHGQ